MRRLLLLTLFVLPLALCAGNFTIVLQAPAYSGQVARLYRYDDLFTLRTVRIAEMPIGDDGAATLNADVQGMTKLQLRIGDVSGDLFARPGTTLNILFPQPATRTARSLGNTTRVDLEFRDLDVLDINALVTDLNERVDAFIAEDLATDQAAGMQAVGVRRSNDTPPDTAAPKRPATLFVTPVLSQARADSFELKLRRFYAEVKDPWFAHYLDNSMAGLHQGTNVSEKTTFDRWIKGRTIHYDDPEQVRFLRSFFADQLPAFVVRYHDAHLQRALAERNPDSLKAVFAKHDFLKDNDQLCELVAMDQLYLNYHAKYLSKGAVKELLTKWSATSAYPEHRRMAANMLWDRTTMQPGSRMPAMLLENEQGQRVELDSLLNGPVCLVITASWCTYCELEFAGLEQLQQTYKDHVRIIAISLDSTLTALRDYRKAHPGQEFTWLHAQAEQQLREDLRLRSLPTFYMLNDGVLGHSPAPMPSKGLGALFQQVQVATERDGRIKVWDD
jgi:thiol-disulfide isomerase/thioredoxin